MVVASLVHIQPLYLVELRLPLDRSYSQEVGSIVLSLVREEDIVLYEVSYSQ